MPGSGRAINAGYLEDVTGGDWEFVGELLETYLETAPDLLRGILDSAKSRDSERAVYASHTLKGSSRSIGAEPLGQLCQDLEQAARAVDMDSFAQLAKGAEAQYIALCGEIEALLREKAA